ncbi:MAG: SirB2 family protein [Sulfuricaulis sp.]|uniref:SirB2 family protein n=1 Tax=Sulfuricaulis sp. TaxID=2003553 RepID=UPI0034A551E7
MLWIKYAHVACVILSGTGYFVRGLWMMYDSPLLLKPWVKVSPHIVDTTLLASAVLLVMQLRLNPLAHGWLAAKVVALVAYIVIGAIGLKYGRTKNIRVTAWVGALIIFGYIVLVALTRQVLPFAG